MNYDVDKNVPIGQVSTSIKKCEIVELAEKMQVGDSVLFEDRWEEHNNIARLMHWLNNLYGVAHNQKLIRACTRRTLGKKVRVWRVDPYEKIKEREANK